MLRVLIGGDHTATAEVNAKSSNWWGPQSYKQRNGGMDITINLHIAIIIVTSHAMGFTCMEIYGLW